MRNGGSRGRRVAPYFPSWYDCVFDFAPWAWFAFFVLPADGGVDSFSAFLFGKFEEVGRARGQGAFDEVVGTVGRRVEHGVDYQRFAYAIGFGFVRVVGVVEDDIQAADAGGFKVEYRRGMRRGNDCRRGVADGKPESASLLVGDHRVFQAETVQFSDFCFQRFAGGVLFRHDHGGSRRAVGPRVKGGKRDVGGLQRDDFERGYFPFLRVSGYLCGKVGAPGHQFGISFRDIITVCAHVVFILKVNTCRTAGFGEVAALRSEVTGSDGRGSGRPTSISTRLAVETNLYVPASVMAVPFHSYL